MKKSKFLYTSILTSSLMLGLTSCGGRQTLLFLNWGEYIDETMIEAFEEKYNCSVQMDLGDSNEIFYSTVRSGTTCYDVVCPSDYMVEKMYSNGMLQEIDFSRLSLSGYNPNTEEGKSNIREGVKSIIADMDTNLKAKDSNYEEGTIQNYFVPYLWGTWGIMYTTEKEGLEEAVSKNENQWASLFDRTTLPSGTRVAMYNSYQHAYFAASRYFEHSTPLSRKYGNELPDSELQKMKDLVSNMSYDAWGTDNIKKDIVAGNIDVGFMWTGDFLYYYCEEAAERALNAYENGDVDRDGIADMLNELCDSNDRVYEANGNSYTIGFDFFIPDDTVAFCDNLVITKDATNVDLAYKFIDFMSSYSSSVALNDDGEEPNLDDLSEEDILSPAFTNTYYVCYDAWSNNVYDDLVGLADPDMFEDVEEDGLYDAFYDYVTGLAFKKYYEKNSTKGEILATFTRDYIKHINTAFNNARS